MDYKSVLKACNNNRELANNLCRKIQVDVPPDEFSVYSPEFNQLILDVKNSKTKRERNKNSRLLKQSTHSFAEKLYLFRNNFEDFWKDDFARDMFYLATTFEQMFLVYRQSDLGDYIESEILKAMATIGTFNDWLNAYNYKGYISSYKHFDDICLDQMARLLKEEETQTKSVATPSPSRILEDCEFYEEFVISP